MFPSSRQREASLDNCTVVKVVEVVVVRVAGVAEKVEVVARVGEAVKVVALAQVQVAGIHILLEPKTDFSHLDRSSTCPACKHRWIFQEILLVRRRWRKRIDNSVGVALRWASSRRRYQVSGIWHKVCLTSFSFSAGSSE